MFISIKKASEHDILDSVQQMMSTEVGIETASDSTEVVAFGAAASKKRKKEKEDDEDDHVLQDFLTILKTSNRMAETSNEIAARTLELLRESNSIEKGKRSDENKRGLILERNDYEKRAEALEDKIRDYHDSSLDDISNPDCKRAKRIQENIETLTGKIEVLRERIAEINAKL